MRGALAGTALLRRFCSFPRGTCGGSARATGASAVTIAKACFGDRACGIGGGVSAVIAIGGAMVGRLVSKAIASGHLCSERRRIMVLSTSALASAATSFGKYQSVTKRSASKRQLVKVRYRPRGIVSSPFRSLFCQRVKPAMVPFRTRWQKAGKSGNLVIVGGLVGLCGRKVKWLIRISQVPPLRGPGVPIG